MLRKILVVDDEESVRYSFQRFLEEQKYNIETAKNGGEALKMISNKKYDLIILDVRLPDMSGLDLLKNIKAADSKAVVLIITAFGTMETAIEATKLGAYDYILKPFDIPSMKVLIDEALKNSQLMRTQVVIDKTDEKDRTGDRIIGSSPVMREVYKMIGRVAGSDVNILLRGESGTGKELVARAIYQHSSRSHKPFLAINCAAIPETLLESELFGYEKGAFTGASRRKIGKFEQVDGGTIFLDEIGDMTLSTQSKILRVLQEGCFEHLGGEQGIRVDVRVIAATNRNLEKAIEEGKFREDLYYRIKVVTITLPPLRLKENDIPELVAYFLNKHSTALGKEDVTISNEMLKEIQKYHWPGNVRELENVIRRAIVLSKSNVIPFDVITEEFQERKTVREISDDRCIHPLITKQNMATFEGKFFKHVMSEMEKELILFVLRETGGNQVQAAKMLGISRVKLYDRIKKYGIKSETMIVENDSNST
ncbi:MAG: sigma-54 dependent transcriptional regulator [bacterium]